MYGSPTKGAVQPQLVLDIHTSPSMLYSQEAWVSNEAYGELAPNAIKDWVIHLVWNEHPYKIWRWCMLV